MHSPELPPITNFEPVFEFHAAEVESGRMTEAKLRNTFDWITDQDPAAAVEFVRHGLVHDHPEVAMEFTKLVPDVILRDGEDGYGLVRLIAERAHPVETKAWTDVRLEMVFHRTWTEGFAGATDRLIDRLRADEEIDDDVRARIEKAYLRSP